MDIIYEKNYHLSAVDMDCYNRLRCSRILSILQEVAGDHSALLDVSRGYLMEQDLFWAVIRHRICITRLPRSGENITVKTFKCFAEKRFCLIHIKTYVWHPVCRNKT